MNNLFEFLDDIFGIILIIIGLGLIISMWVFNDVRLGITGCSCWLLEIGIQTT